MRTFPLVRRLAAGVAVLALGGCWIVAGLDDRPLRGAEDGGGEGGPPDGITPPPPGDDGPVGDAPSDGDAGQPDARLCVVNADAAICDDFDDAPLDASWNFDLALDGSVTVGPPAVSPPNAAVLEIPAPGDNGARAMIQRDVGGAYAQLVCDFELQFDVTNGGFEIAHVEVGFSGTTALITLSNDAIKAFDASTPVTKLLAGTWVHHQLVIDIAGQKASLSRKGAAAQVVPFNATVGTPETTTVSFGLRYLPGVGEERFRIDDVVCVLH